jgi:hypothetical protein
VAQGFIHFGKLALFCLGIDRSVPIWSGGRFGLALQDDSRTISGERALEAPSELRGSAKSPLLERGAS